MPDIHTTSNAHAAAAEEGSFPHQRCLGDPPEPTGGADAATGGAAGLAAAVADAKLSGAGRIELFGSWGLGTGGR